MSKLIDPIPPGFNTGAGAGKTTLMSRMRIRDFPTTLDRLWRYGGVDHSPYLLHLNLSAANCPWFSFSHPALSGLVQAHLTDEGWRWSTQTGFRSLTSFLKNACGGYSKVHTGAVARMKWRSAIEANTYCELGAEGFYRAVNLSDLDFENQYVVMEVFADGTDVMPTFVVAVVEDSLTRVVSEIGDAWTSVLRRDGSVTQANWARIARIIRKVDTHFSGTGVPNQVVIEGFTRPPRGGLVLDRSGVSTFMVRVPKSVNDLVSEVRVKPRDLADARLALQAGFFLAITDEQLAAAVKIDAYKCLAAISRSHIKKPSNLFNALKAFAEEVRLGQAASKAIMTPETTGMTTVESGSPEFRTVDVFWNAIGAPRGDTFIETMGQYWNFIPNNESILKGGMSSGINRALDAATGNAVWLLYVSRGDPESDAVSLGFLAGLEGGVTGYTFDSQSHLTTPMFSSHRVTGRAVAHIVCDSFTLLDEEGHERKALVFVDSPTKDKPRMCWLFLCQPFDSHDEALTCKFICTVPAANWLRGPIPGSPACMLSAKPAVSMVEVWVDGIEQLLTAAVIDSGESWNVTVLKSPLIAKRTGTEAELQSPDGGLAAAVVSPATGQFAPEGSSVSNFTTSQVGDFQHEDAVIGDLIEQNRKLSEELERTKLNHEIEQNWYDDISKINLDHTTSGGPNTTLV